LAFKLFYITNSTAVHLEFLKSKSYILIRERGCYYEQQDKSNAMRLLFS
jgi:hypothetical protein